ncbi:Uncharacterised protein [Burkholderia pseudomallei]|nr:Uncharacterised protein [Burkholderia pseudomallei]
MILQIAADAGQVEHDRNVELAQPFAGADARALQQLRRCDRAAAHEHFAARVRGDARAAVQERDARCALAGEQDAIGKRVRDDFEIRPRARLVEIAARGRGAAAARRDRAVHRAEAFLLIAVEIVGARIAGLHAGLDHRLEQRIHAGLARRHGDRAVTAVIVVRADIARLGLPEVRQAIEIRPVLEPLVRRPVVVIERIAADVAHPIDQRRAAEPLAAPAFHPAVVHVRLGIGFVRPVVAAALQRVGERRRHLRAEVETVVGAARLEEQHGDARILGEARREHVARGAGAADDVVEFACRHRCVLLMLRTPVDSGRARPAPI